MRKLLTALYIIQIKSNKGKKDRLGKGYSDAYRFNPFNPLSYIALILIVIVGLFMFGFVGFWKEADLRNPFKWN